jgi:hypothetical protein
MKMIKPGEEFPINCTFQLAVPSFVYGGWTLTNPQERKEKRLPKWEPSPMRFMVTKKGEVYRWHSHNLNGNGWTKGETVEEFREEWMKDINEYLSRNNYTMDDVFDD